HTPNVNWDNGVARDAKIYFQDIGNSAGSLTGPTSMSGSITNAQTNGAYIQNNSWGTSSNTYDTNASAVDSTLYSNPYMVVTVSAGNAGTAGTGTIGSPSTAKNCINVGGVDAANPTRLYEDCSFDGNSACSTADAGSSQGPVATSNRIKPDICGIFGFTATVGGENEAGARPYAMCQTDTTRNVYWDYTNSSGYVGTSFASPEIAGLAALVRDYFMAGYYPTGTATPANAFTPYGSLVKAVILASGEPLSNTAYPSTSIAVNSRFSNQQGYGRANLPAVLR
ncbi:MAG: S8 family serine peptidase, partial [Acidobacteria bacterium]|nr:S8 family serine peptidase [Acidobacteriota bacterium]